MEDFHWIHSVLLKADIVFPLLPLLPFLPRSLRLVPDGRSDPPALLFHQRLLELGRSVGDVQTGVRAGDGGGVLPGKHGSDHEPPHLPVLDGVAVLVLGCHDLLQEPRLVRLELPRIPLLLALVGDLNEERLELLARAALAAHGRETPGDPRGHDEGYGGEALVQGVVEVRQRLQLHCSLPVLLGPLPKQAATRRCHHQLRHHGHYVDLDPLRPGVAPSLRRDVAVVLLLDTRGERAEPGVDDVLDHVPLLHELLAVVVDDVRPEERDRPVTVRLKGGGEVVVLLG